LKRHAAAVLASQLHKQHMRALGLLPSPREALHEDVEEAMLLDSARRALLQSRYGRGSSRRSRSRSRSRHGERSQATPLAPPPLAGQAAAVSSSSSARDATSQSRAPPGSSEPPLQSALRPVRTREDGPSRGMSRGRNLVSRLQRLGDLGTPRRIAISVAHEYNPSAAYAAGSRRGVAVVRRAGAEAALANVVTTNRSVTTPAAWRLAEDPTQSAVAADSPSRSPMPPAASHRMSLRQSPNTRRTLAVQDTPRAYAVNNRASASMEASSPRFGAALGTPRGSPRAVLVPAYYRDEP